jgi:heterodisulfide reductase subunit C
MDYLRSESLRLDMVNPKAKDILSFHKAFLDSVKATGRLYEVGLIAGYKIRSWHFLQDVTSAPSLYFKGKLKLLPHFVDNRQQISKIFDKFYNNPEENQ